MTDKEFNLQKKRIKFELQRWWNALGIDRHNIDVVYHRDYADDNNSVVGRTYCNWQYMHGTLDFFLPAVANIDENDMENMVVHELVHIIAWPLWDNAGTSRRKENEYAIECMARALIDARRAGQKDHTKSKRGWNPKSITEIMKSVDSKKE